MSRNPRSILDDLVAYARQFRTHEEWLTDPLNELGNNLPVFEMEKRFSGAASGFFRTFNEYKARVAELPYNPFSYPLRDAIEVIPALIESRLRRWGWDLSVLTLDGYPRLCERCKADEEARVRAVDEAAVSWRSLGRTLRKDLKPHPAADRAAFRAEQRGVEPTMTPEEGERAYPQRVEEWAMKLMIGQAIPQVAADEHDQLCRAVTELAMLASREWSPTPVIQGNPYSQSAKDAPDPINPKSAEDWSFVVATWKLDVANMLDYGSLWTDQNWDVFGLRSAKLLQFALRTRPDLDASPLAELVDVPSARHRPRPELFMKFLRSVELLEAAVETMRSKETASEPKEKNPPDQANGPRSDEGGRPAESKALASKASSLDDLTPTAWKLLEATRDLKAVDSGTATNQPKIVAKARKGKGLGNHDSKHNQAAFAALSALGLIIGKKRVGTWITGNGMQALDKRSNSG